MQFDHRLLALTSVCLVTLYWWRSRKAALPPRARLAATALLHTTLLQATLGIATLLLAVPVLLGALHQATAMLLLAAALFLTHGLTRAPAHR